MAGCVVVTTPTQHLPAHTQKKPDVDCNKGGTGYGGPWRNAIYTAAAEGKSDDGSCGALLLEKDELLREKDELLREKEMEIQRLQKNASDCKEVRVESQGREKRVLKTIRLEDIKINEPINIVLFADCTQGMFNGKSWSVNCSRMSSCRVTSGGYLQCDNAHNHYDLQTGSHTNKLTLHRLSDTKPEFALSMVRYTVDGAETKYCKPVGYPEADKKGGSKIQCNSADIEKFLIEEGPTNEDGSTTVTMAIPDKIHGCCTNRVSEDKQGKWKGRIDCSKPNTYCKFWRKKLRPHAVKFTITGYASLQTTRGVQNLWESLKPELNVSAVNYAYAWFSSKGGDGPKDGNDLDWCKTRHKANMDQFGSGGNTTYETFYGLPPQLHVYGPNGKDKFPVQVSGARRFGVHEINNGNYTFHVCGIWAAACVPASPSFNRIGGSCAVHRVILGCQKETSQSFRNGGKSQFQDWHHARWLARCPQLQIETVLV
jgi:hypothetical protein